MLGQLLKIGAIAATIIDAELYFYAVNVFDTDLTF
jgi:hypothetical protein